MTDRPAAQEHVEVRALVPRFRDDGALARSWPEEYRLRVEVRSTGVLVQGDAAGLRGLAVQLLALAQDGVPDGHHADLDDFYRELDEGSAPLTIQRADTRQERAGVQRPH